MTSARNRLNCAALRRNICTIISRPFAPPAAPLPLRLSYTFVKAKPRVIHYRCYKDFDNISFRNELKARISVIANYDESDKVYLQVLNNHAPMKSKTVRANHAPYMSKALRKAIMRRSYLEGKYYKIRDPEMGRLYRKQRNFCSRLYKKERKKYYTRLDIGKVIDNRNFRKTMKPFLTGKGINSDKITLIENENILDEDGTRVFWKLEKE